MMKTDKTTGKKNIAVMDLGTNTIRLLIAKPEKNNEFQVVYTDQSIVRMGRGLSFNGSLSQEAMERTMAVLTEFKKKTEDFEAEKIIAVGTSALREAGNREDLVSLIRSRLGFDVSIISGEEEGRLTVMGVMKGVGKVRGQAMVVDIGGGSTEFISVEEGILKDVCSADIGVVSLAERFLHSDPVTEAEILKMERDILMKMPERIIGLSGKPLTLIGTAGTFTTLAAMDLAMRVYQPHKINGHRIRLERVKEIFKDLKKMKREIRRSVPGLEKGREDVIIPGTVSAIRIMEFLDCKEAVISDYGLREGILINSL
jgi:exopolyphosphatase/guanosine-5'-triphosphate,3'-diphosphate pyrophosphatase